MNIVLENCRVQSFILNNVYKYLDLKTIFNLKFAIGIYQIDNDIFLTITYNHLRPYKDYINDDILFKISTFFFHITCLELCFVNNVTDKGIFYLSSLKSLKHLTLYGLHRITDHSLKELNTFSKTLKTLCIKGCDRLTDVGLLYLSTLTNIYELWIYDCHHISDTAIQKLVCNELKEIKYLRIALRKKLILVEKIIENCIQLKTLHVYFNEFFDNDIVDADDFEHDINYTLSELTKIKILSLDNFEVESYPAFQNLNELCNLKKTWDGKHY